MCAETISGRLIESSAWSSRSKKILTVLLVSLFTALIFIPDLIMPGFDYSTGEVAVRDIKSPLNITSGEVTLKEGEIIVREGDIISEATLFKLSLIGREAGASSTLPGLIALFVFSFILLGLPYCFASKNFMRFSVQAKDLLLIAVIFAATMVLMRFSIAVVGHMASLITLSRAEAYLYTVPIAFGPVLVMLFLNAETALLFSVVTAIMASLFMGPGMEIGAYFFIGSVAASMGVRFSTQRSTVIKAGLLLSGVNIVTLFTLTAFRGDFGAGYLFIILASLFNGIVTAILAVGVAPLLESLFNYTTNIKLLELSRMDHPLLKRLANEAPGTFHHSIIMGSLVEAAAEAIDANPLLARVSAYYHDIGKLKKTGYFIENMKAGTKAEGKGNKHDKLSPSMSALIITSHLKDGVDMARNYRLGRAITGIIGEHHGTSLIHFFFEKARREEAQGGSSPREQDYRYPGPKPQTKEAGIVMLADSIEAASRTLPDPTSDRIKGMTQKIVNKFFADGQLDDCELTLKDLHAITKSFNRVFSGIYHHRVDYPEPAYVSKKKEEPKVESTGNPDDKNAGDEGDSKETSRENLKRLGM